MVDDSERKLVFLFDENMPLRLADALHGLGESCIHVYDPKINLGGMPDEVVLRHAGERGWFIVGRDHGILRNPHERAVLGEFNMGAFFLKQTLNKSLCSITQAVVRNWSEMKRIAQAQPRPFLYVIKETTVSPLRRKNLG